jgi:small-conductance mechanosensitive channel
MREFGADALLFDLVLWTDEPLRAPRVQSDIAVAVNAALGDAGIKIPFPQRNLHLQSISGDVAEALQNRGDGAARPSRPAAATDGA